MIETLLHTKLFVSPLRPNLVPRSHLIQRLNQGLEHGHKLALISAPAGFGKTTLISEWVGDLRAKSTRQSPRANCVAWLSLDESDNDPARFLAYLIAALKHAAGGYGTVGEPALSMLQSPQPPPTQAILTSVINEIAAIPDPLMFVLDDYHVIDAASIDEAVAFLLEHLPPHTILVIATRDDPDLPLARLRAGGRLSELRAVDLRFSPAEVAAFLNEIMGLDLSGADIAMLETRTEGWIAGLQLAAVSIQGRPDVSRLIKAFSGSNRYVLDYLIEEVLEQQPESTQSFLLQTAVLNRLTGSLCDALTGQEDGQATLESLEHANLFIVPLDNERRWYRYHHLFADLLRNRLRQFQPELLPDLHRRAAEWYEQFGAIDEAIGHALRGKHFEPAANLIESHIDGFWGRGEHPRLRRWLAALPMALVLSRPQLSIFYAWYLFVGGQQATAEQCLRAAEQSLEAGADVPLNKGAVLTSAEKMKRRGRVATIRAFMASFQGDVPAMIQYARTALAHLPEQDRTLRRNIAMVLGDVYGFQGDMVAAYDARYEAYKACQAAGDVYFIMLASMKLAITLRSQGCLQHTIDICAQQNESAAAHGLSQSPLNGLLLIIRGEVLAELDDLDSALEHARKGIKLTETFVDEGFFGWGNMCMIRILFSRGDFVGANAAIEQMETKARTGNVPPWIVGQMATWQVRLWLAEGRLDAAAQWVTKHVLNGHSEADEGQQLDFFGLFEQIMFARVLIAQNRLDEAARQLQPLLATAEAGGRITRVIEIALLCALVRQALGDTDQALVHLEQALTLAEPEGFVRIFVEEGPDLVGLLHAGLHRGLAPAYVRSLLAAFPEDRPVTDGSQPAADQSALIEPLSERELEVLQLIAQGLTNRDVSERLFLALNTVKVHTRNIYGKLAVNNRSQAVARAWDLNILRRS